jgi:hypothetical protein
MAQLIQVFVCNKNGESLSGQKVKLYGGSEVLTGKDGYANLTATGSECTVYVNGVTVYDGYASKAPNPIIYKK